MCRTSRTNPPIAGQHNGRENPQQTHLLTRKGHSPANREGEREAYTLFVINTQRVNPIEVELTVNGADMTMELDMGAAISIIGEQTYRSTWPSATPLEPSTVKLGTYSGDELVVLGS